MKLINNHQILYVEIFAPLAKSLAYWHQKALGFTLEGSEVKPELNRSTYYLKSKNINLLITSSYPTRLKNDRDEVSSFIDKNYCGLKRFALRVENVQEVFKEAVRNGAQPLKSPKSIDSENGTYKFASIRLYDENEIVFVDDSDFKGVLKPGLKPITNNALAKEEGFFEDIDHIAAELGINKINQWSEYLTNSIGTKIVQKIEKEADNTTGMVLNINQSENKQLTLVMAEPDFEVTNSKIQNNLDLYGEGIHHLAFSTNDMITTLKKLRDENVDFVNMPSEYYELLRNNKDMADLDIDLFQEFGILVDKIGETYLLQKFIKPISERPYFFYEIVQRVKGYNAFALNNIKVLKKAEELQIMNK